jgi:hypothetical protein
MMPRRRVREKTPKILKNSCRWIILRKVPVRSRLQGTLGKARLSMWAKYPGSPGRAKRIL